MKQNTSRFSPFEFLADVIRFRLQTELTEEQTTAPDFNPEHFDNSSISRFIQKTELPYPETVTLLLALVPHLLPGFLNNQLSSFFPDGGELPEFGGVKGEISRGIFPTGETVLYILAGNDLDKRLQAADIFDASHIFRRNNIISIAKTAEGEPKMSGRLLIDEEYLSWITRERVAYPEFSEKFPAQRITTELDWKDLVLEEKTMTEIREIEFWLKHNDTLMNTWGMKNRIKPGYRVMFYGDPGTGKTMTATLLGKHTQKEVYRIDLSMVVSKFIGETEKNLSNLFSKAEHKNWILFFDEADSMFGKRTDVRDAHDKYANQEVSYLLQRIENYSGLVILASNFKKNIDTAFTRRFQSIIEFKQPSFSQRLKIWGMNIPEQVDLAADLDLESIAADYELTGANIINVIQYAGINTLAERSTTFSKEVIIKGIKKEYIKEGRMM